MFEFLKTLPQAAAIIKRVMGLFAGADLDFEALTAEGVAPDALSKLIDQRKASAVEEATKELEAQAATLEADLGAERERSARLDARVSEIGAINRAILAGLVMAGVDASDFDGRDGEPLSEAVSEAIVARVQAAAAERLAESGVPVDNLPEQVPVETKGKDELWAEFNGMSDAKARGQFWKKHCDVMLA